MGSYELKIDVHPSGRRTLKTRSQGERVWKDMGDDLRGALDEGFYGRVLQKIGEITRSGGIVVRLDISP